MSKFLVLVGMSLLLIDHAFAQGGPEPSAMQCHLVRLAVAQYGYAAARQHALETYGPEAVATGDKCFAKQVAEAAGPHARRERRVERNAAMRYQR